MCHSQYQWVAGLTDLSSVLCSQQPWVTNVKPETAALFPAFAAAMADETVPHSGRLCLVRVGDNAVTGLAQGVQLIRASSRPLTLTFTRNGDNPPSSASPKEKPTEEKPKQSNPSKLSPRTPLSEPSKQERDALFKRMDYNGNGFLSLAEIDKAVLELWPDFDHKPALMRAYKAADVSGDGLIGRREFRLLLRHLSYFNELWHKFEEMDTSHDRRISPDEFIHGCGMIGVQLSEAEALDEFAQVDANGGGYVLFDEFCSWAARRHINEPEDQQHSTVTPTRAGSPSRRTGSPSRRTGSATRRTEPGSVQSRRLQRLERAGRDSARADLISPPRTRGSPSPRRGQRSNSPVPQPVPCPASGPC